MNHLYIAISILRYPWYRITFEENLSDTPFANTHTHLLFCCNFLLRTVLKLTTDAKLKNIFELFLFKLLFIKLVSHVVDTHDTQSRKVCVFESVHFLFNMSSIARKKKLRTYQVASYKNELIELLNFCGGQRVVLRRRKYMFAN